MTGIFFVSLAIMMLSLNIGWLLPTLVGGAMSLWGQSKQDDANNRAMDQQQAATNAQSAFEREKFNRMTGQQDQRLALLDAMLQGKDVGISAGPGGPGGNYNFSGMGALPQSQKWLGDYYNYLQTAPDTTYNAQVGELEGGLNRAYKGAAERMNRRGMLNSGAYGNLLAQIGMEGARGRSRLGGERVQRQGEMLSKGTQLSQGILDRIMNLQNTAYGMQTPQSTQVPQMMAGQAGYYANQGAGGANLAEAGGNLMGQGLLQYLYGNQAQTPATLPGQNKNFFMPMGPKNLQFAK